MTIGKLISFLSQFDSNLKLDITLYDYDPSIQCPYCQEKCEKVDFNDLTEVNIQKDRLVLFIDSSAPYKDHYFEKTKTPEEKLEEQKTYLKNIILENKFKLEHFNGTLEEYQNFARQIQQDEEALNNLN